MSEDEHTIRTRICASDDIPEDEGLRVDIPGYPPLAAWRAEGEVYVTDDTCTHGQASLSEGGEQDGFIIECGLHLGEFDMRDGSAVSMPCTIPLRVYTTVVTDNGDVYADLSPNE